MSRCDPTAAVPARAPMRVLFVDDDPALLAELRTSLQNKPHGWLTAFASDTELALDAMRSHGFDAVVADLQERTDAGASFLDQLRDQFPDTVRITIAGPGDAEQMKSALPLAHQFLASPWVVPDLVAALARAEQLRKTLTPELRAIVGTVSTLPSAPRIYGQLERIFEAGRGCLDDAARVVRKDAAISARLLQLVNSAMFAGRQPIATIEGAAARLGARVLKDFVLASEVFSAFDSTRCAGFDMAAEQAHSVVVARTAAAISGPALAPYTFTSGLLHDVGKLILGTELPAGWAQVTRLAAKGSVPQWLVEREVFGVTHAQVGAYLLGIWGLPAQIVETVGCHHWPALSATAGIGVVDAVHIADGLIGELAGGSELEPAYLERLGVTEHLDSWRALAEANYLTGSGGR